MNVVVEIGVLWSAVGMENVEEIMVGCSVVGVTDELNRVFGEVDIEVVW